MVRLDGGFGGLEQFTTMFQSKYLCQRTVIATGVTKEEFMNNIYFLFVDLTSKIQTDPLFIFIHISPLYLLFQIQDRLVKCLPL